ncbi:hypothetical protein NUW58_g1565 [Xylaria curta]|uniref:Uncharacterized protein n=1 Tax=Xylaria curta TaxID=42375 RepID=A0ACC1PLG3_9PEZI|nr:hypothetical protein NUW58_g1565 [Xylaria curta]
MDPRFPIADAPDPSAPELVEESLKKMVGGTPPFPWIEDDGQALLGCYAPMCYSPEISRHLFEMGKVAYQPTYLTPLKRELAILGLISILKVPYMVYCHRIVSSRTGLTAQQYDDGLAGKVPEGLSKEEDSVYRLSRILTTLSGPLEDATWHEFTSVLGKAEMVAVVHLVGAYRWLGLLTQVNGGDNSRWMS